MTLPRKPPLVFDWSAANLKRGWWCRVCGRADRKIELAHVLGIKFDTANAVVVGGRRVAKVDPDRVIPLCGPSTNHGTCHHAHDHKTGTVEVWDFLSGPERRRAIEDAGSLGQALRRCAPRTWLDRVEIVDGVQVEMEV